MSLKICIALLMANLVFALVTIAQNVSIPQQGFSISTDDSVMLEQGTQKKIRVMILRAKPLTHKNVRMGISSTLPDGVTINFKPDLGDFDLGEATIQVSESAKEGTYFIVLNGTIQYKTKGRVLKLIITKSANAHAPNVSQPAG